MTKKLSYETYDANRTEIAAAINHYQRILNNEEHVSRLNCPLCQKYNTNGNDCVGCPIYEITGKQYCEDTPYAKFYEHSYKYHPSTHAQNQCPICTDLITEEITFLRSLHPFHEGDIVEVTRTWTDDEDNAYNTGIIYDHPTGPITEISMKGNCKIDRLWYPPVVLALISPHESPIKSPHKSPKPKAQISYKQAINRGRKEIVVTGFYNILKREDLPAIYVDVEPYFYQLTDTRIYSSKEGYINVGDAYFIQRFDEVMSHLHKCSARLHDINKQLQIENAGWEGVEKTIDI
jgi:hypothetical protein